MSITPSDPTAAANIPIGTALLAASDVPACIADAGQPGMPIGWVNAAFEKLVAGAVGRTLREVLGGQVVAEAAKAEPGRVDTLVREAGHVEVSLAPVPDPQDGPGWVLAMILDVDARSVEVREAQKAERRWRALVESLPVAVYRADWSPEAAFRYLSPQIESILGRPAKEFVRGRAAWITHLHEDDREQYVAAERAAHQQELEFCTQYRMIDVEGKEHRVWERDAIVRDEDGAPRFSHGVLIDVTHRTSA